MAKKSVPPSIKETAFECPHCGAYTTQFWHSLFAIRTSNEHPTPSVPTPAVKDDIAADQEIAEDVKKSCLEWVDKMLSGLVLLEYHESSRYLHHEVHNLYLSECYNCKKFSVWVHDSLVFPRQKASIAPNPDLPDDIIPDFEEAREIVDASPRGAAALLRLCIQKLCKHLGEKGKDLDEDIASLVKKGLNPLVQQSLDIVRVIGNEAVHPGVVDLKDDRDIAMRLFELVNAIAEQMISHPKAVQSMYGKLPEPKRKAIEKRDHKQ